MIKVKLPIRYGRKSSSRHGTYSMVFSINCDTTNHLGIGYIVPLKKSIENKEVFKDQIEKLAKAEGIIDSDNKTILTTWRCTCILENAKKKNKDEIAARWWKEYFKKEKEIFDNAQANNKKFADRLRKYGETNEIGSVDAGGFLNISFPEAIEIEKQSIINDMDFLLATSNQVKLRTQVKNEDKYPNPTEIAKAMWDAKCFNYFKNNRKHGIVTFEDAKILKSLKKYFINDSLKRLNRIFS